MFNDSIFELSADGLGEHPSVLCFELLEGVSGRDYLLVSVLAKTGAFNENLLGKPAKFAFEFEGRKEFFHGIIADYAQEPSPKGFSRVALTIKTQRHLIDAKAKSVVFCETDFEAVSASLFEGAAAGGNANFAEYKLNSVFDIDFCIQYGETDLDFFERMSEARGIFNFAKHSENECQLIIGDSAEVFGGSASFSEAGGGAGSPKFIKTRIECGRNGTSGKMFFGYGHVPMRIGGKFNFFGEEFIVCSAFHSGSQEASLGLKGKMDGYVCQVSALPESAFLNLPKNKSKPQISGVVVAKAEGFSGSFASLDSLGRYRVRMPFDEQSHGGAAASSPVFLSQNFAGENFGAHFPLRKGTPMLIAFENGDIDCPIALGAVPDESCKSPVTSKNANQNILRTAGGIEFIFDDSAKGLSINAPADISIKAGGRLILQGTIVEIN